MKAIMVPMLAVTALAAVADATAGEPFSFETAAGRLPKTVVPLEYRIALVPDVAARTFRGTESVSLEFRKPTDTIVFNSLNEMLSAVELDGAPVQTVASNNERQLTTVTLAKPAAPGRHMLTFAYVGQIESEPQGLFVQSYSNADGSLGTLLTSMFEPADARRMFPCWDEPAFRASFELTVTVPSSWQTVSNMPVAKRAEHGDVATTTFAPTPKMATYLLHLSAGAFAQISASAGGTALAVWTVRGQQNDGETALANAGQILGDYNAYFGYSYPLPKLDSIAIPGGFGGAMENWGAIAYNDRLLLVKPSSTAADRQTVYAVQAHEMAHQWNGDLVTMGWWDDIWLNESFASWMAARETDLRHPTWNWWEAQDASKESAMAADARLASHPIEQHVSNELQATHAFDPVITYSKGEAVLRMLEAYLGADKFRDGVRAFMNRHAYSNATTTDLWNALNGASAGGIAQIAADWTAQAGFPLVNVEASCDADGRRSVRLTQKRFVLQGTDPQEHRWRIPLQIRSGTDARPLAVLLTHDGQTESAGRCGQALTVNADSIGFYRALYDAPTLKANTEQFGALPRSDRIALLDDQWALVEAGAQPLAAYLGLAAALGDRPERRAWSQINAALETIEYAERGTAGHDGFVQYARTLIKPVAVRLGWDAAPDETPDVRRLRQTLLQNLGDWEDGPTIEEARRRFGALMDGHGTTDPDERQMVLAIVSRHADRASFEQLHAIARSASDPSEARRDYLALTRVRDPLLAEQAARIALSDEIAPQLALLRADMVLSLASYHPALAWKTLNDNLQSLMAPYASERDLVLPIGCAGAFWNTLPPGELEAWLRAHVSPDAAPFVARAMETARFKRDEKAALVAAADRVTGAHALPPASAAAP